MLMLSKTTAMAIMTANNLLTHEWTVRQLDRLDHPESLEILALKDYMEAAVEAAQRALESDGSPAFPEEF